MKKVLIFISIICCLISCQHEKSHKDFYYYFKKGNTYLQRGSWDNAIDNYQEAISKDEVVAAGHYQLALAYYGKLLRINKRNFLNKVPSNLQNVFDQVYETNLKSGIALNDSTEEQVLLIRYLSELKLTTQLSNEFSDAHHRLALMYKITENFEAAEAEYRKAIEINPNQKQYSQELIKLYQSKLVFDPYNDALRCKLTKLFYEIGEIEEALEEYNYLKRRNSNMLNTIQFIFDETAQE